jgi:hypothetical protein
LREKLTWQVARSVGEIQFLTRASYVALFLVPILAGVWQSVRVHVNSHNEQIALVTTDLAKKATALDNLAAELIQKTGAVPGAQEAIASFSGQVRSLSDEARKSLAELKRAGSLSPWLPQTFVLAFFAALAVAVGHFIYQASAPAFVRKYSQIDYVRDRRQSFRDQPYADEFEDALKTAQVDHYLKNIKGFDGGPNRFDPQNPSRDPPVATGPPDAPRAMTRWRPAFREHFGSAPRAQYWRIYFNYQIMYRDIFRILATGQEDEAKKIQLKYKNAVLRPPAEVIHWFDALSLEQQIREILQPVPCPRLEAFEIGAIYKNIFGKIYDKSLIPPETIISEKLDVIGEAARIEYLQASRERKSLISITFLFYGLGFGMLLWLLIQQCRSVLVAAGWIFA